MVQEILDRRRPSQGRAQYPDFLRHLTRGCRGDPGRQFHCGRLFRRLFPQLFQGLLGFCLLQGAQLFFQFFQQAPFPAHEVPGSRFGRRVDTEQDRRLGVVQQMIEQCGMVGLVFQRHQPQVHIRQYLITQDTLRSP